MEGYVQISLANLLAELGEERVRSILSKFSCPLNQDVEHFLSHQALEFAKQNLAPTHLIFTEDQILAGYFTLTMKSFFVGEGEEISKTYYRKISKFGADGAANGGCVIPAPLIAQLGKNFADGADRLITGGELLKMACDKIAMCQRELGGKVAYLECEDKPKLLGFYRANGFVVFGRRMLDKEDHEHMAGQYLLQLLKIIKN